MEAQEKVLALLTPNYIYYMRKLIALLVLFIIIPSASAQTRNIIVDDKIVAEISDEVVFKHQDIVGSTRL